MDLRQLEYVDAIARRLSFTRAARDLHVAQPALSKSIANLEEELGTRLFERTSRRVTLTDAGATFVASARRILADVSGLRFEIGEFSEGMRGAVSVSTWYHVEPLLPQLLHDFIAQYPRIQVSVVELAAAEMVSALLHDEIDLAVSLVPPDWDVPGISHGLVRHERLVVVVRSGDRLAKRSSATLSSIADSPLIAPLHGTALRSWFDRSFAAAGIEPHIVVETNELAGAVAYVAVGLGLAILPGSLVPPLGGSVAAVKLKGVAPVDVVLAWHDCVYRTPAAARALAFAQAQLPNPGRIVVSRLEPP